MNPESECTRCGKCCLHMRRYITIERSIGEKEHYCECRLSRDRFFARLGGMDLNLFKDKDSMVLYPESCPFLRTDEAGKFICTVYSSRPVHCRTFFCKKED